MHDRFDQIWVARGVSLLIKHYVLRSSGFVADL